MQQLSHMQYTATLLAPCTLLTAAQQSLPYMHMWSNITRSHKTKTEVHL